MEQIDDVEVNLTMYIKVPQLTPATSQKYCSMAILISKATIQKLLFVIILANV